MKVESILNADPTPVYGSTRTRRVELRRNSTETENAVSNEDLDRRDEEQHTPQFNEENLEDNESDGESIFQNGHSGTGIDRFA
jgi:hypothetical protein